MSTAASQPPSTRAALIIIGTFKDAWRKLDAAAQKDFFGKVSAAGKRAGIQPTTGYRLISARGAFLQVWEGDDHAAVARAVQALQAMDYAHFVDARFLIGERDV